MMFFVFFMFLLLFLFYVFMYTVPVFIFVNFVVATWMLTFFATTCGRLRLVMRFFSKNFFLKGFVRIVWKPLLKKFIQIFFKCLAVSIKFGAFFVKFETVSKHFSNIRQEFRNGCVLKFLENRIYDLYLGK